MVGTLSFQVDVQPWPTGIHGSKLKEVSGNLHVPVTQEVHRNQEKSEEEDAPPTLSRTRMELLLTDEISETYQQTHTGPSGEHLCMHQPPPTHPVWPSHQSISQFKISQHSQVKSRNVERGVDPSSSSSLVSDIIILQSRHKTQQKEDMEANEMHMRHCQLRFKTSRVMSPSPAYDQ